MPNVFEPDWDAERDEPPFRWRRARIARQAGARDLGASLFELPPGAATFPLHAHYANEEMLIVLGGRPTLTGLEGKSRELEPGEVVACPAGRNGAHRLDNRTDEPAASGCATMRRGRCRAMRLWTCQGSRPTTTLDNRRYVNLAVAPQAGPHRSSGSRPPARRAHGTAG